MPPPALNALPSAQPTIGVDLYTAPIRRAQVEADQTVSIAAETPAAQAAVNGNPVVANPVAAHVNYVNGKLLSADGLSSKPAASLVDCGTAAGPSRQPLITRKAPACGGLHPYDAQDVSSLAAMRRTPIDTESLSAAHCFSDGTHYSRPPLWRPPAEELKSTLAPRGLVCPPSGPLPRGGAEVAIHTEAPRRDRASLGIDVGCLTIGERSPAMPGHAGPGVEARGSATRGKSSPRTPPTLARLEAAELGRRHARAAGDDGKQARFEADGVRGQE